MSSKKPDERLAAATEIAGGDHAAALRRLAADRTIARAKFATGAERDGEAGYFLDAIKHYVYAGDTLLHVAAAAHACEVARALIEAGADVRAKNRRGAEPLHYACDGGPGNAWWNPVEQAAMVALLVAAGAGVDAKDKNGVAPIHRAVRTRCTGAVRALLEAGADAKLANKSGSTPADLAAATTGRSGAGSPDAKVEQEAILRLLSG